MLNNVKQQVYEANMRLYHSGLVILTWGNVSQKIDDYIVIKPSGVEYERMQPKDMVVVDIKGNIIDGKLRPSVDLPTHLELYKASPYIKGICHTHSCYASSFAQAGIGIKPFGTTHADYFYGEIPCTRELTKDEIESDYEKNTAKVIIEEFETRNFNEIQACLVKSHGIFSWGDSPLKAVENAVVLEEIAKMNYITLQINPQISGITQHILNKHYSRKHSYYGQAKIERSLSVK